MRSLLFITAVLSLAVFSSASTPSLLDLCNVVNINNVAVFDICDFKKTGPLNITDTQNPAEDFAFNWSLVSPQAPGCPGSGNTYVYATVKTEPLSLHSLGDCYEIAGTDDPVVSALDSSDEGAGLTFTYPNKSNFGYQLVVQLVCSSDITTIESSQYNVTMNDTTVLIAGPSSDACPTFSLNMLASFMQKYKYIFVGIFVILGILICFFGFQTLKVTIFIIATVLGTVIFGLIFFQFTHLDTKPWVLWVIFVACLILGLLLGYLSVRFETVGFVALGMVLGGVGGLFLFNLILAPFVEGKKYVLYLVCSLLAIIGGFVAYKIWKKVVVVATAVIGSYMIVRALSIVIGGFPSEESIASGVAKFSGVTYAYLAAMIILAIAGAVVQWKRQKEGEEEEEQNAYEKMMGGGNYY